MFKDEARIFVKAGQGGSGMVTFRREKYVPFGGPSGGDGGPGGDVVLLVSPRLNTLSKFQHQERFAAEAGKGGGSSNKTGTTGQDLEIAVPPGTIARDAETGTLVADLTAAGQRATVARGGRGGRGNARFKSSTNQAPRIAEKGEPGEERWLMLELKLIADVGIVGVPNAGKSTLLSVLTSALPKIGAYPFTTISPNLGVAILADQEIVLADIPGLVEGAHNGVGLGDSFLRHIQRTRVLVHLLDGAGQDPIADFVQTNTELTLFDPALAEKQQIVVLTKIELDDARKQWDRVEKFVSERGLPVLAISSVTHTGLQELMNSVIALLVEDTEPVPDVNVPEFAFNSDDLEFEIRRENESFRVVGQSIERAAAMTYWEYHEAVVRFHRIMTSLGITEALQNAGVVQGDIVLIGPYELEWQD
jgi:GTP-binding protein